MRKALFFKKRVEPINWRKIAAVDLFAIQSGHGFDILQENLMNVGFGLLETDLETPLDQSFVKLFCLAQYLIEYLLHSQDFLSKSNNKLSQENQALENDVRLAKNYLRNEIKDQKLAEIQSNANKCRFCKKKFVDQKFLKSHMLRRHVADLNQDIEPVYSEAVSEKQDNPDKINLEEATLSELNKETQEKNYNFPASFSDKQQLQEILRRLDCLKKEIAEIKIEVFRKGDFEKQANLMAERLIGFEKLEKRLISHFSKMGNRKSRQSKSMELVKCDMEPNGTKANEGETASTTTTNGTEIPKLTLNDINRPRSHTISEGFRKHKTMSKIKERTHESDLNLSEDSDSSSGSLLKTTQEVVVSSLVEPILTPKFARNFSKSPDHQYEVPIARKKSEDKGKIESIGLEDEFMLKQIRESGFKAPEENREFKKDEKLEPQGHSELLASSLESNNSVWNDPSKLTDEVIPVEIGESVEVTQLRPRFHSINASDVLVEEIM